MLEVIYFVLSGLAVWSKKRLENFYRYAKPLPILLLLIYSFFEFSTFYFYLLFLLFSLLGDFFLLGNSRKMFLSGLVAFLSAHVFFIVALIRLGPAVPVILSFAVIGASASYFIYLFKHIGDIRVPVFFYLAIISIMVILSGGLLNKGPEIFIGAVLFYFSDAVLAYVKFVGKNRMLDLFALALYFIAQGIIFRGMSEIYRALN